MSKTFSENIHRLPFDREMDIRPAPFHYEEKRLEHAIDFAMPIGTPVLASLDGIVDTIIDGFGTGGPDKSNLYKCNIIRLKHLYGEYSLYVHLSKGINVKKGEIVKTGMLLGYSGDSGYNTYPHLHFHSMIKEPSSYLLSLLCEVMPSNTFVSLFPKYRHWQTIPVRFQIGDEVKILRSPKE